MWCIEREKVPGHTTARFRGLQSESFCRSWLCRWGQSSSGSWGTRLWTGHTGSPCSSVSRRSPTSRSPPGRSYSGSGRSGSQSSRCHTHTCDPGSSCPHRRWSRGRYTSCIPVLFFFFFLFAFKCILGYERLYKEVKGFGVAILVWSVLFCASHYIKCTVLSIQFPV